MNAVHPVLVLAAFAIATLVTYAVVLAALSAASTLPDARRDDAPDDSHDPREGPAPTPDVLAGTPLPPWVPPASGDRTLHQAGCPHAAAPDRRSHVRR